MTAIDLNNAFYLENHHYHYCYNNISVDSRIFNADDNDDYDNNDDDDDTDDDDNDGDDDDDDDDDSNDNDDNNTDEDCDVMIIYECLRF
jgi:hypothetical protein